MRVSSAATDAVSGAGSGALGASLKLMLNSPALGRTVAASRSGSSAGGASLSEMAMAGAASRSVAAVGGSVGWSSSASLALGSGGGCAGPGRSS
jgi:hypothetical protein